MFYALEFRYHSKNHFLIIQVHINLLIPLPFPDQGVHHYSNCYFSSILVHNYQGDLQIFENNSGDHRLRVLGVAFHAGLPALYRMPTNASKNYSFQDCPKILGTSLRSRPCILGYQKPLVFEIFLYQILAISCCSVDNKS